VSETIRERYTAFRSFCSTLENSKETYRDLPSFSRLACIQALHGLARIQALHGLARIQALLQISVGSYDACQYLPPPSSSVVYADPPYIGTAEYTSGAFDHERFYNWLRSVPYPVYTSEYHMPDDFIPIAETKLQCTLSATGNNTATERLFLHRRFAHPDIQLSLF
jgi:site-specific DNA-adenine methylase